MAVGESVGVDDAILPLMVVIDVAVANIWMAFLLLFAGREKGMDASLGANRETLEVVRESAEKFAKQSRRTPGLSDLFLMLALGFGGTATAWSLVANIAP